MPYPNTNIHESPGIKGNYASQTCHAKAKGHENI